MKYPVWLNTTKDHKGALHRTTEDRQYRKGPTKDCKGTLQAKLQEIGTNWTQWCLYIPVRAKIFHMLPDLVDNLRSLIASQYAEADCPSVDVEISFFVADWKALSEPQWQLVRHAVFSLACKGVAAWHAAINIYRWQPDRPAPSRIQMLRRNWEVFVNQVPTAQNKKQKLWLICAGVSKWSFRKPP